MAVDRDPKNYSAWTELGISRMASGIAIPAAASAARKALEKSLDLRPEQQRARYQMSILQHRAGHYAPDVAKIRARLEGNLPSI